MILNIAALSLYFSLSLFVCMCLFTLLIIFDRTILQIYDNQFSLIFHPSRTEIVDIVFIISIIVTNTHQMAFGRPGRANTHRLYKFTIF